MLTSSRITHQMSMRFVGSSWFVVVRGLACGGRGVEKQLTLMSLVLTD